MHDAASDSTVSQGIDVILLLLGTCTQFMTVPMQATLPRRADA